jgi:hypothetical protein
MNVKSNPFLKSMARLQLPAEMGRSLSVGGFELEADDEGTVEVPKEHVAVLKAHGLVDYVPRKSGTIGTVTGSNAK